MYNQRLTLFFPFTKNYKTFLVLVVVGHPILFKAKILAILYYALNILYLKILQSTGTDFKLFFNDI